MRSTSVGSDISFFYKQTVEQKTQIRQFLQELPDLDLLFAKALKGVCMK